MTLYQPYRMHVFQVRHEYLDYKTHMRDIIVQREFSCLISGEVHNMMLQIDCGLFIHREDGQIAWRLHVRPTHE